MKLFTLLFAIILFSIAAYSQSGAANSAEWVTLENENKELAFSIPKNYLVNITSDADGKEINVMSFQNGVSMEVYFSKEADGKQRLNRVRSETHRKPLVNDFAKDDFTIKIISYDQDGYDNRIYLASKKYFYIIKAASTTRDKPEIARFLQSIKLNNQPVFIDQKAPAFPAGEVFVLQKLKTSERILKALAAKTEKIDRRIKVEPLAAYVAEQPDQDLQKALILTDLKPPAPSFNGGIPKGGEMRIKLQLLAGGQIGDITVYTDAEPSLAKSFANAAKNMKFIPASRNNMPVDSFQTKIAWVGVSQSITMFD